MATVVDGRHVGVEGVDRLEPDRTANHVPSDRARIAAPRPDDAAPATGAPGAGAPRDSRHWTEPVQLDVRGRGPTAAPHELVDPRR